MKSSIKKYFVMMVTFIGFLAAVNFTMTSNVSAAPGEATNVLARQVVSYVNAVCQLDPASASCGGAYHSPQSHALLYVPQQWGTASVTYTRDAGNTNGVITSFTLQPLTNAPGYVCGAPIVSRGVITGTPTNIPITNNPVQNGSIRTITNHASGQVYNVYCVIVTTGPPYRSNTIPSSDSVGFSLSTDSGAFLGVFSGPQTSQGTGYWPVSYSGWANPANRWSQVAAFSNPCNVDGSNNFSGNSTMTLYDLDTYAGINSSMNVYVQKTLKPGIASAPDGGVAGAFYNIGLSGTIVQTGAGGLTQLGGNVYRVNNIAQGNSMTVNVTGEQYTSQYIYSLYVENIGAGNKIRIRLPYDQINSVMRCVENTPPSIQIGLNPCTATGVVSFNLAQVADGQTGTLSISGGYGNVNVNANQWTNFSAPNFNGIRDGVTRTLTLTVTDSGGLTGSASATYRCTVPAPSVTCTFVTPAQTLEVGDAYYPVVRVSNGNVAGAPNINASTNISVNFSPPQLRNTPNSGPIAPGGSATYGAGTSPTVTYPSNPATGAIVTSAGSFTATATATYTATAGGYSGTIPCTGSLGAGGNGGTGVFRPYFKVLGGDIITYGTTVRGYNQQGVTFDPVTSCATAIRCGAGVETALQVQGTIDGVPSRYKQASSGAGQKTLTYANTLGGIYATWGGGFGGSIPAFNYTVPTSISPFPGFGGIPDGTESEYTFGAQNFSGGTVSAGSRVTIYRTGNLRISSNIVYTGSGSYPAIGSIPHFRIVTTGNIFIDPAVNQLDGEYIALGQIYTCHNGVWTVPIATNIFSECDDSSLIVNGALIADSIKLTRTVGTRRAAQVTDGSTGGCVNSVVSRGYCNMTNIAEIIQFTPELFIARPASSPTNENLTGKYNSVTSLPPLF